MTTIEACCIPDKLICNYICSFIQIIKFYKMSTEEKVLETMRNAGEPLNAGKIAELSGLDKKEVEKAMTKLKTAGSIISPKRCYWSPSDGK